jgi:2,4-dienoyl-CoA reductase-like NADH-dependent reductase (Old Yellow Enzyme family)
VTLDLFDDLAIGTRVARNRLWRAATTSNLSDDNSVGDRVIAHYRRLADGGVGTIVTEALRIHPSVLHGPYGIAAFDPARVPGLAALASSVHEGGALLIGQVNHSGRQHTGTSVPPRLVGPSPVACPRSGGVPHPLSVEEIAELADGYVRSALNIAEAGFDGVELNGAQGHLLQQFLSPFSNERDDRYGGDARGRATLARELLERIRTGAPDGFVVGYRLGVDEFTEGGLDVDLTTEFALLLQDEGLVDYVSFSQGNFNSIAEHLPDRHYPHTPYAELQSVVGRAVQKVATIACTGVVDPEDAERVLAEGWADGVAMSRALTVDPDWPNKTREGRRDEIRPCIQCNYCWSGLHEGLSTLVCVQNSEVGRELEATRLPAPTASRRVVVVGGGPAGLEFARVASGRGHRVTVFETRDDLGGKVAPGRGDIGGHPGYARAATWLSGAVGRAGVDVRTGRAATATDVLAESPDVVVVATGAQPVLPRFATDGSVHAALDVEELDEDLGGRTVLVFDEDGHYWAAQVAEEAAARGAHVVLVTRFFEPFRELAVVSKIAALRRLDQTGTEIVPMHELVRFEAGGAVIRHYDSRRERVVPDVHAALWVGPQLPQDALVAELAPSGVTTHLIGDARSPRRIRNAIREAFDLANRL